MFHIHRRVRIFAYLTAERASFPYSLFKIFWCASSLIINLPGQYYLVVYIYYISKYDEMAYKIVEIIQNIAKFPLKCDRNI
jgi:hypothetical protein